MSLAETAELVAEMNLKGDFPRQAAKMQKSLGGLNADTKKLKDGLSKVGKGISKGFKTAAVIGAGAMGFLALNVRQGFESLAELDDVERQTAQAIKSTGGVAKVTAGEVRKLAEQYEDLTTVDDKVIQRGENLLLGFTNIRKKAFEPTIKAALDMATALDMDTTAAFTSLGKALNDPAAGLSRLTRLGVSFTAEEKKKITALSESGRKLEAQRIILGKLNRLYGGRAVAAAAGYRGSLNRLKDSVEGLQQSLARPLIRPLTTVANKLAKFANTQDVQDGIRGIGEAFASLFESRPEQATTVGGAMANGIKAAFQPSAFEQGLEQIKGAFQTVKTLPWDQIRGGLQKTFDVAAKAVDLFKGLPPELQTALVTLLAANKLTGGLVASGLKDIASVALKSLTTITAANVTVVGRTVTGPGSNVPTPGGPPSGAPGGPGGTRPTLPFGGAVIAITADDLQRQVDRGLVVLNAQLEQQRRSGATSRGIEQLARVGQSVTARIASDAALQARLAPVSNDILNGIANNTTTIPEDGRATRNVFQTASEASTKNLAALSAKVGQVRAATAAQTPVLGSVKSAVDAVRSAVKAKDLSVRVTTNVSATTIVDGVTRVTNGNRVVIS